MSYRCRICSKTFDAIPDDAIPLPSPKYSHGHLYVTAGAVHDLKPVTEKSDIVKHLQHVARNRPALDCTYC